MDLSIKISKCTNTDQLFDLWTSTHDYNWANDFENEKKTVASELLNGFFCKDGIICLEKYSQAPIKVLFVSNEANVSGDKNKTKETDRRYDFINYYENKFDNWEGKLRKRTCQLYQTIIGRDPLQNNMYENALDFAFMNLNKRGGLNNSSFQIANYCVKYADFIKREIDLIAPDIIIWCSFKTYNNVIIRDTLGLQNTEYNEISIYNSTNKLLPVIKTYHTSAIVSEFNRFNSLINSLSKLKNIPQFSNYLWIKNYSTNTL